MRLPPDGVEYYENEENSMSEIHATISGPEDTPFLRGLFRMKLVISSDWPNTPPRGYFLTKIFHPNVAPNGDICVNTLKKDWTPTTTMKHVLQVIRCLLMVPFPESSLNDEAGKLFMDSYEEYATRARIMTEVHAIPAGKAGGGGGGSCSANGSVAVPGGVDGGDVAAIVGVGDVAATGKLLKTKEAKKKSMKRL